MADATALARRSLAPLVPPDERRTRLAWTVLALGAAASVVLLVLRVTPGAVTVPLSLALLGALVLVPFPRADRWLAAGVVLTLPLLPPSGLPNLPVSAGVVGIALVRLLLADGPRPQRRTWLWLAGLWALLGIGVALAFWPPPSMWLRPAVLLAVAVAASVVGVLAWRDADRRARWLDGLAVATLAVGVSALAVFALQYVLPIGRIVDLVAGSLGYLRGDAAAAKFDTANNWIIWGTQATLRAVSPLLPSPNNTGGVLGLAVPILAAHAISRTGGWRTLSLAAVGFGVTTLCVTYSRSSWVALVMAGVVIVLAVARSSALRDAIGRSMPVVRRLVATGLAAVALGGLLAVSVGQEVVSDRVTDPLEDPSVTTRVEIDEQALAAISGSWLRGVGLGNWEGTLERRTGRAYIHNVYLEYGAATGLFGLAWSVALVAVPLGAAVVVLRRSRRSDARLVAAGVLGAMTFTAIQFLFDDNLLNPQYAWILLAIVGGSLGLADEATTGELDGPAP